MHNYIWRKLKERKREIRLGKGECDPYNWDIDMQKAKEKKTKKSEDAKKKKKKINKCRVWLIKDWLLVLHLINYQTHHVNVLLMAHVFQPDNIPFHNCSKSNL